MEDDHRPPGSVLFAADRSNTHSTSTTPNSLSVLPFLLPTDFLPFREASTDRRDDQLRRYSIHDKRWIFLGLAALPLWILFGNLLVLLSVIGFRHLRTLSNWVIASLAFTDFLLALTVVPFGIYQLVNRTWDLGLTACLFWTGSDVFLSTTSIMHLCAIAIHRHLGIAYPLRMRRGAQNRRHVLCLLLPAWTVSAAVSASLVVQGAMNRHSWPSHTTSSSPSVQLRGTFTMNRHTVLVPQHGDELQLACGIYDHTFAIYSSMLSFFVPLAVMVVVEILLHLMSW